MTGFSCVLQRDTCEMLSARAALRMRPHVSRSCAYYCPSATGDDTDGTHSSLNLAISMMQARETQQTTTDVL